jgi:hypothetical protein
MPNSQELFSQFFDIGKDVMSAVLDATTKVIVARVGSTTAQTTDSGQNEWWQHTGFSSKPAPPTQGNVSCQTMRVRTGRRDIIFATRDTRSSSVYGNLKDGEACVYATVGQARTFYKANGSIVHYTTANNTTGGSSVTLEVGPAHIQMMNQFGSITIDSNGITLNAQGSSLTLGASGKASLVGQTVGVTGSGVSISGSIATSIGASPGSQTLLGASATPATAVGYGAPGSGPAPVLASTTVFVSP